MIFNKFFEDLPIVEMVDTRSNVDSVVLCNVLTVSIKLSEMKILKEFEIWYKKCA